MLLHVAERGTPWAATACLDSGGPDARILLSARVHDVSQASSAYVRFALVRQTENLRSKIAALDRLQLVATSFAQHFSGGRLFVFGDVAAGSAEGWAFCRRVVRALRDYLDRPIISQLDYDQRRLHPDLSSALDSLDFATKHEPSAVGTVVSYRRVLEQVGGADEPIAWAVKGAGQLGSRIIRMLSPEAAVVYAAERAPPRRRLLADLPNVEVVPSSVLARVPATAFVFAADTGTLTLRLAKSITKNGRVRIVGGPEAGLDRNPVPLNVLDNAGIWFIPSVLCGSMGLVSNLEEALGHVVDIDAQADRLGAIVAEIATRAIATGTPFHKLCSALLRG